MLDVNVLIAGTIWPRCHLADSEILRLVWRDLWASVWLLARLRHYVSAAVLVELPGDFARTAAQMYEQGRADVDPGKGTCKHQ